MSLQPHRCTDAPLILILDKTNRKQLVTLLDKAFNVPTWSHYYDDFTVWDDYYSSHLEIRRFGIFDAAGVLISTASVRLASIKHTNNEAMLPIALMGAVATDDKWRGRGLASILVSHALEWAKNKGAALSVLWGSEHELYRRLGFELCGDQLRKPLAMFHGIDSIINSDFVKQGWVDGIWKCMLKREGGLNLEASDIRWISAHKNVQWYWSGGSDEPSAYAAIGKGIDLHETIHEWGGSSKELMSILCKIKKNQPTAVILGCRKLFDKYDLAVGESVSEYLCLANIIDPTKIFLFYYENLKNLGFSAVWTDEGWTIFLMGKKFTQISQAMMVMLFFGPLPQRLSSENDLTKFFPLPLWFWGLDGV
ncbi:MAG: GNAT family N-acetyltransferase [Bdellovibrionota bacterium]